MNSSAICSKRYTRFTARHACPALKNRPIAVAAVARRMSASSQTIIGSLPPSSSVTRVTLSAASFMIRLPVSVCPVNAILFTFGCETRASPISAPGPCTVFSTPAGMPTELMILVLRDSRRLDDGMRERLALLEGQQLRDLGYRGLHLHRRGVHEGGALGARERRPRRESFRGGLDRRVDLRRGALRDRVHDLAVRGISDLDRLSRLRGDGLAVDEHRCHEEVLPFGGRNA